MGVDIGGRYSILRCSDDAQLGTLTKCKKNVCVLAPRLKHCKNSRGDKVE